MNDKPNNCFRCGSAEVGVAYGTTAYCYCKTCGLGGKAFSGRQFAEWIDREAAVKWWNESAELSHETYIEQKEKDKENMSSEEFANKYYNGE